jgi:hypothetical protein
MFRYAQGENATSRIQTSSQGRMSSFPPSDDCFLEQLFLFPIFTCVTKHLPIRDSAVQKILRYSSTAARCYHHIAHKCSVYCGISWERTVESFCKHTHRDNTILILPAVSRLTNQKQVRKEMTENQRWLQSMPKLASLLLSIEFHKSTHFLKDSVF